MNDQTAAQLISQSLFEPLTEAENLALKQHLAQSPQSQQYAELSSLIQNSLTDEAEFDDNAAEPGLSQIARARIAKRIEIELLRLGDELNDSQLGDRKVAEDSDKYTKGDSGKSSSDDSSPETT